MMKTREMKAGVLAIAFLLNLTITGQAGKVVPLDETKGAPEVQVSLEENDLTVLAREANEIRVQASDEDEALDPEKVKISQQGNRVSVHVSPDYQEALDLFVPVASKLKLSLTDGDLHVDGTEGAIEASVVDGDVILSDVRGPCVVETVDGDIVVGLNVEKPRKPVSLSSVDGDVVVRLLASTKATVAASTVDGTISSELKIENTKTLSLNANGKGPAMLSGTLNGGGTNIRLQTVDGDIRILKHKAPKKIKKQRFF